MAEDGLTPALDNDFLNAPSIRKMDVEWQGHGDDVL